MGFIMAGSTFTLSIDFHRHFNNRLYYLGDMLCISFSSALILVV